MPGLRHFGVHVSKSRIFLAGSTAHVEYGNFRICEIRKIANRIQRSSERVAALNFYNCVVQ
jgi:hypothetical protein